MHRSPSRRGFTLIEMITVITIIAILAGLILSVNGLIQRKAASSRAQSEIEMLKAACESYKADNGGYPQDTDSDSLDPRNDVDPNNTKYKSGSLVLYKALSGDANTDGKFDTGETKNYAQDFFKLSRLGGLKSTGSVLYIQDPFGYSYGYSTAGLKVEQDFRVQLTTNPNATRGATKGYNPNFDVWSTGGGTTASDVPKWIKNW